MEDNIFIKERKNLKLADYMQAQSNDTQKIRTAMPEQVGQFYFTI